jgi:hypothetical protein
MSRPRRETHEYRIGTYENLIHRGMPVKDVPHFLERLGSASELERFVITCTAFKPLLPPQSPQAHAAIVGDWLRSYGYLPPAVPATRCSRAECGRALDARRGVVGDTTGELYHPMCHPRYTNQGT